ncbi:MAG: glycerol-3-phosphate 1-O-acyltransferase PlsY [Anaerolineales bacterium]|nr:MAG: glycerol-3-phosphate 1-O-acyltransferase PlsY [Anaerolineales bacterium]
MDWLVYGGMIALAYLIGSISTGYVMGRLAKGIDIRQYGSGRTGGTNALRTLGPAGAVITGVGDVGKGAAVVLLAKGFGLPPLVVALMALAAVIGHNHSIFLSFHGGAGVAPTVGALLVMGFWMGLGLVAVAVALVGITKYASVGSLALVNLTPLLMLALGYTGALPLAYLVFGVTIAALITWAHRPNIARLRAGSERKLGEGGIKITAN